MRLYLVAAGCVSKTTQGAVKVLLGVVQMALVEIIWVLRAGRTKPAIAVSNAHLCSSERGVKVTDQVQRRQKARFWSNKRGGFDRSVRLVVMLIEVENALGVVHLLRDRVLDVDQLHPRRFRVPAHGACG